MASLVMAGVLAGCAVTAPPAERARSLPAKVQETRAGQNDLGRGNRREQSRREYIVQRIERRLRELRAGRASVVRRVPDRVARASRVDALFQAVGIDDERSTDRPVAVTRGAERVAEAGATGSVASVPHRPVPPSPHATGTPRPPATSPSVLATAAAGSVPVTGAIVAAPGPSMFEADRDATPAADAGTASLVTTSIATGSIVSRPAVAGSGPPAAGEDMEPDPALAQTVITGSLLDDLPPRDPPGAGGTATGSGADDTVKTRGAHLASYPDRVSAMRGWRVLLERHPVDLGLHVPMLVYVRAATGTSVWLVTAVGEPDNVLRVLCRGIRQGGGYCAPVDLERPEVAGSGPVPAG